MASTPYPLALFQGGSEYGPGQIPAFTALVGVEPVILNCYFDGTQTPLPNTGSASYVASTFAGNAPWNDTDANGKRTKIPLIGSPMGSSGRSDADNLAYLQAIAADNFDSQIKQFVTNFTENGFMTQYWRPGVEMNLSSTPGYNAYVGDPAAWIAAFQRIYTLFHEAGAAAGATIKVIWNPGVTAGSGPATKTLWPGKQYVDIIGLDCYSDLWPWGPLTDAEILSSPANMKTYYSNPAWNGSNLDASGGLVVSLPLMIEFALEQGLPFAICETGAGSTGNGGPADNPVFWEWEREQLDAGAAQGLVVEFVSFWDSNGGGTYQFTGGQQPNACAAIAANFGVNAPPAPGGTVTPPVTPPVKPPAHAASPAGTQINGTTGTIYDTNGNAWTINSGQFIVRNGTQIPVSADVVTLFWDGKALSQLNTSNDWWTQPLDGSAGTALTAAPAGYKAPVVTPPVTPPVTTGPTIVSTTALPQSEFTVYLSADEYNGNAEAEIQVDGLIVATNLAVTALNGSGQEQAFTWMGSYGAGKHVVKVTFLNDAYGGSASKDRNLYFKGIVVDGTSFTPSAVDLFSTGSNGSATVTTLH